MHEQIRPRAHPLALEENERLGILQQAKEEDAEFLGQLRFEMCEQVLREEQMRGFS